MCAQTIAADCKKKVVSANRFDFRCSMEDVLYEENLQENQFFIKLKEQYKILINEAASSELLVLIPKRSSLTSEFLTSNEFLLSHILLPSDELPKTHFTNFLGVDVTIDGRYLRINNPKLESLILFEEVYYTNDLQKFKLMCVESPLYPKNNAQQPCPSIKLVKNVSQSLALITEQTKGSRQVLKKIDSTISNFCLRIQNTSDYEKLKVNVKLLYEYCLNLICRKRQKTIDPFLLTNIKIALEYYVMDVLYEKVFDEVSIYYTDENQKFNKALKKATKVKMEIPEKIAENLNLLKIELLKIADCKMSLDKLYCIRNVIDAISLHNTEKVTTVDELLPILCYLFVKTNYYHWMSTILFIKDFNLSQMLDQEHQSSGSALFYILTTFEAVIYFIETNPITDDDIKVDVKNVDEILNQEDYLQYLFQYVKSNNEIQLNQLINLNYAAFKKNESQPSQCHPLCTCIECGSYSAEPQSNVNLKSPQGNTMLHIASAYNVPKMITVLLGFNADVDLTDNRGWNALHHASYRGHQKVVFLLLHGNSSINIRTKDQQTALHLASMNGHDCCVKAVLYFADHKNLPVDLNAQDIEGNTALHYASQAGFEGIIESLLEYKAKVNIRNHIGKAPFDYSYSSKIKNMLETAAKYQVEEFPVSENEYVFISNEDLADNLDDVN